MRNKINQCSNKHKIWAISRRNYTLISYLEIGYANMRTRQNLVDVRMKAGAVIIELGVPAL
jgi:tryptophan synthase alpha subunit